MLEVRPSGGKTYYQRYTDGRGRERQFKIGPPDVFTLDQARRQARSVLKQAIIGTNPQEKRAELRTVPMLGEFARERYLPHVQSYKRSWHYDEIILLHILPALGRLPLDEIRQENISDLLQQMRLPRRARLHKRHAASDRSVHSAGDRPTASRRGGLIPAP